MLYITLTYHYIYVSIHSFINKFVPGCKVNGVDLSTNNINKAQSFLREESRSLNVEFHEANFFELPEYILEESYSHVWAQVTQILLVANRSLSDHSNVFIMYLGFVFPHPPTPKEMY